jgi:ABC-2 type transport system ATP-binding protein
MRIPPAIAVSGLTKYYGRLKALNGVSFAVSSGSIFGYLGPNGAGKTTTINILSGLLPRDGGDVTILGVDVAADPIFVKTRTGVVPDESNLYPELTCRRNLDYLGELYGLPRRVRKNRVAELLALFGLEEKATSLFASLSRGLKRRLTIAGALIHSPALLFLDEPTSGLDVPSARGLRNLIKKVNENGTTVFLTTHNLYEAQGLCHRVLILHRGTVVAEGTVAEIRKRVEHIKTMTVAFSGKINGEYLSHHCPAIHSLVPTDGVWRLEVSSLRHALSQISAFAEATGVEITAVNTLDASLEDAFVELLRTLPPEAPPAP